LYRAPRGTADVMPVEQKYWRYIESKTRSLSQRYGYSRLDTPIFEHTGLFVRGVGEGTDIVEKEMYSFLDRGGESFTLRPEGTAAICRAYLEHGMANLPQPVRLYYLSPAFRYERPQAGRFRQHQQFGVEAIGDSDPAIDAEVVELAWYLMGELNLNDVQLIMNSIGDSNCRPGYIEQIKRFYASKTTDICEDCHKRLTRNPLRLLDCKKDKCQEIAQEAPRCIEYLCSECLDHWEQLLKYLDSLNIPYTINHRLVRGLDYYTRTVFEIQPINSSGQSTICAGGRYDGLIGELDGEPTPGIGFASGFERIILNLKTQGVYIPEEALPEVVIAYLGTDAKNKALTLASKLRKVGIGSLLAPGGKSLKSQMRYANSLGVPYVAVLGEDEIEKGTIILRNMSKGEQQEILEDSIENYLNKS